MRSNRRIVPRPVVESPLAGPPPTKTSPDASTVHDPLTRITTDAHSDSSSCPVLS